METYNDLKQRHQTEFKEFSGCESVQELINLKTN